MKKLSIIIPAYNEENRITNTIKSYTSFFNQLVQSNQLDYELILVLNGCTDNTVHVVHACKSPHTKLWLHNLRQAGKGRALIHGFKDAISRNNDLIGFVDADMSTKPEAFYALMKASVDKDGVIASRYIKGASITPARPLIKRWGSKYVYEPLVWFLLGLGYKDLQCGAKLFHRHTVEAIIDKCTVFDWAFDIEFLYLCKKQKFAIKEVPTVWTDQEGSKLNTIRDGLGMLKSLISVRLRHR